MKFAVFTVSLPEYAPEQALQVLKEAGYDGVEWRVVDQPDAETPGFWAGNSCTWPLSSFVADAPRIRAITKAAGLAMPNVGTYVTCEDLAAVDQAMRGAALLGAPSLRVNVPNYDPKEAYLPRRDRAQAQYREVAALARQHGVRALIEIHMGNLTPSASAAAQFLAPFDPRDVGVIHDAGNMVHEGYERYRMGLEVLGPYLGHVHIKDGRWVQEGERAVGGTNWHAEWAPIGEGVVDFRALIEALQAVGYDGWLSIEDFSTALPLAERTRSNIAFLRSVIAEVGG